MTSKLYSKTRGMDFFTSEEILNGYLNQGACESEGRIKEALKRFESFWPDQQKIWYGEDLTTKIRTYLKNAKTLE
jgi:hypothetical protein